MKTIFDRASEHITELGNNHLDGDLDPVYGLSASRKALLSLHKAVEDQRREHGLSKSNSDPKLNISWLLATAKNRFKKETGKEFEPSQHPKLMQALIDSDSFLLK
jgi:hypothetical protein